MFSQRQTSMENAFHSAVAVLLLLISAGRSAELTDVLQTTEAPLPSDASMTTQINNSSMEGPRVQRLHRSCGIEHENFCENGGECMYPQDNDQPFCICKSSYGGTRCLFIVDTTRTRPELEQLIGIIFGVLVLIAVLAMLFYCFVYKRCVKSAQFIKAAPSESPV